MTGRYVHPLWCASAAFFLLGAISERGHGQDAKNVSDLIWLSGVWERQSTRTPTFESWRPLSLTTWEGSAFRVKSGTADTTVFETLLLARMGSDVFYIAKVDENTGPVGFALKQASAAEAVFENMHHDFPQTIHYSLGSDGLLTVVVSASEGEHAGHSLTYVFRKKSD